MTKEEIVREFQHLPSEEREAVVEEILGSIREEPNGLSENGEAKQIRIEAKLAAVDRLRGLFKTDAPLPTGEELKEDYTNYLAKKYS